MDAHTRLEFEMSIDSVKELQPKLCELARSFYDSLKVQNFTDEQALYITSQYVITLCGIRRTTEN